MYHDKLKEKIEEYSHLIYRISRSFPSEERYGTVSQIRRASLSVLLNYVEGYSRRRPNVLKNFLEISYGSLKESDVLIDFCEVEGFIKDKDSEERAKELADEIGAMLWRTIINIK